MCPLVQEIERQEDMESIVCLSGQHRDLLEPVLKLFDIKVHYNLDIMRPRQTLTSITCDILDRIETILIQEKPDMILVHGDTTTSFATALAAFYQKIPVGHVEAGLRSFDRYSPYPEEINRSLTARLAELHFAPTEKNRKNLRTEGIRKGIVVTGNTVIDAFHTTFKPDYEFHSRRLRDMDLTDGKWILMTAHRRENLGSPLKQICEAVKRIVQRHPETRVIYPMHPNPVVRETVRQCFEGEDRVYLIEPLDVEDMHNLMRRSYLILTDSGGLQEEGPSCGVPVLVLRTETERPEAVEAGTVKIAGVETDEIVEQAERLITDEKAYQAMAMAVNPYGDGRASVYIVEALRKWWQDSAYDKKSQDEMA